MTTIKIALLGFGTVGQGVYHTIRTHQRELASILGKKVEVAAVLIKNKERDRGIEDGILVTDNFEDILAINGLDVIVEAIVGREPAFSYLQKAIYRGCHVITANKEMFAAHGTELKKLAGIHGVTIGFEATVAGGVPVIQTVLQLLNVNRIKKIEGILNGTSNYILSEMRTAGKSFEEALIAAQEKGYAEADPTNDVEGYDAFYKLMILSEIAFGGKPDWDDVPREGISSITGEQIKQAEKLGLRFKLIASIQRAGGKITGSVRPTLVSESHPLFNIEGVENSVSIEADIVGRITLQGPGAGMYPTASAVIEDLIHSLLNRKVKHPSIPHLVKAVPESAGKNEKQNWVMMGLGNSTLKSIPNWSIAENESLRFLEADETTVSRLKEQNNKASFFEVLGEPVLEPNVFEKV
ncbi:homoserine dehydrogenase [Mesobacillus zeae]|uniref:Homoserine dehydrogenase n=1 Tax=Mesobacillus zeae TaxID=1917180 RepID=A0A398B9R2_9BACI|nr:homoserine dehydrogenase [Mesobacillus zeae]RID84403.1 homoserine dehydrogenase [Mesobacillus zeae]